MENEYKNAKYYDAFLYIFIRNIRHKVLKIVQKYNYTEILDVCCGTGNQLKLLKKCNIGGTGIDISDSMLKMAKSGKYKIDCFKQDAEIIEFIDNSFDLTMTTLALHEKSMESAFTILKEMVRVTKLNGHILIVDFIINSQTNYFAKKGIQFIESLAGGDHFHNYNEYVESGGLKNIVKNFSLNMIEEHNFALGGIILQLLQKIE